MGFPMFFDPTYILIIIGIMISTFASSKLKSTFSKYSSIRNSNNITGAEAAQKILRANGLYDIKILHIPGNLTDHYNPINKTLSLSSPVYNSTSIAAVSVAAHECGHAIQHKEFYAPFKLRSAIVPVVNFGQTLSMPILLVGFIMGSFDFLVPLGIFLFSFSLIFQLVTLPVEYDASSRALKQLENINILDKGEIKEGRKVLNAAALTYVAGVAASVLSVLRLLILSGLLNGRRRD